MFLDNDTLRRVQEEVSIASRIWADVLVDSLPNEIDHIFVKGSTVKSARGLVDYVPLLSDIDIHIAMNGDNVILPKGYLGSKLAINIGDVFEETFLLEIPEPIHIPRTQIMDVNQLKRMPGYIPSNWETIKVL